MVNDPKSAAQGAAVRDLSVGMPFGDGRRDEAPDTVRAVGRGDRHPAAQRAELLFAL